MASISPKYYTYYDEEDIIPGLEEDAFTDYLRDGALYTIESVAFKFHKMRQWGSDIVRASTFIFELSFDTPARPIVSF